MYILCAALVGTTEPYAKTFTCLVVMILDDTNQLFDLVLIK